MVQYPRLVSGLLLAFLIITLTTGSAAYAQNSSSSTTVDFLDERDVAVDWTLLKEQGQPFAVYIHNGSDAPQTIALQLVGLTSGASAANGELTGILVISPAEASVSGGRTQAFEISAGDPVDLKPGSYQGTLVATGSLGGLARRNLTLTVAAPPPVPGAVETVTSGATATPVPVALRAPFIDSIAMSGINQWPSFLNPVHPGGLYLFVVVVFLVLLALLLWWLLGRWPAIRSNQSTRILASVIVLLSLLFLLLQSSGQEWFRTGLSGVKIAPTRVETSDSVSPGSVIAADGSYASLSVEGDLLMVTGIERAGQYKGKIALLPATDGKPGNIAVTVNVADVWPYALITVILGIIASYLIGDYFQKRRLDNVQRARVRFLLANLIDQEEQFRQSNPGWTYSPYSMKKYGRSSLAQVDTFLNARDLAKATTQVDLLQTYSGQFHDLLQTLVPLDQAQSLLWENLNLPPNTKKADIALFRKVSDILNGHEIEYTETVEGDGPVKTLLTDAHALNDWLHVLTDSYIQISSFIKEAEKAKSDDKAKQADINTNKKMLSDAREGIIIAGSSEDVVKQFKAASDAFDIIRSSSQKPIILSNIIANDLPQTTQNGETIQNYAFHVNGLGGNSPHYLMQAIQRGVISEMRKPKAEITKLRATAKGFEDADVRWTLAAGALTVLSGFAALYLPNSGWGAPADYFGAFLWGSVVSKGLELVTNLVKKYIP